MASLPVRLPGLQPAGAVGGSSTGAVAAGASWTVLSLLPVFSCAETAGTRAINDKVTAMNNNPAMNALKRMSGSIVQSRIEHQGVAGPSHDGSPSIDDGFDVQVPP